MRKRLKGLVQVIVATGVVVSVVASVVMNEVKYDALTTASALQAYSSSVSKGTEAASGNLGTSPLQQPIRPTQVHHFLSVAAMKARNSGDESVVPTQTVGRADVEQMVDEALPHIARKFGSEQVYRPPLSFTNSGNNKTHGFYPLNSVSIKGGHVIHIKSDVAHEYIHAQFLQRPFAPWNIPARVKDILFRHLDSASPLNETFTTIVEWDVLANQALEGDALAKASLLDDLVGAFETNRRSEAGVKLSHGEVRYEQRPAIIVSEVMTGERTSYEGIKLDGLRELLRQEIAQARAPLIPTSVTASDLSPYCALPTSKLYCAPTSLDARVEGSIKGELMVLFQINNSSAVRSPSTIKQAGKPYIWTRIWSPVEEEGAAQLPILVYLPKIVKPSTLILKDNQGGTLDVKLDPTNSGKHYYIAKSGELIPRTGYLLDMLRELQGRQQ